jgi:hypothetical protein
MMSCYQYVYLQPLRKLKKCQTIFVKLKFRISFEKNAVVVVVVVVVIPTPQLKDNFSQKEKVIERMNKKKKPK